MHATFVAAHKALAKSVRTEKTVAVRRGIFFIIKGKDWSDVRDSNPRPSAPKADALARLR